eukprot:2430693-Amphidinium_carterae.1
MSMGVGLRNLGADIGVKVSVHMCADASAGLGILRRRGAGKVRHLAVQVLWTQELVGRREVSTQKIPGTENPADVGTKYLDASTLTKCVER